MQIEDEVILLAQWLIDNWYIIFLVTIKYLRDIAKSLFSIYIMIKSHETRITLLERRALNRS